MDSYFLKTIFVTTPLLGEEIKKFKDNIDDRSITGPVDSCTLLSKLSMIFNISPLLVSGYMNAPIEPNFLSLENGMEYIMHHPHEPIM